MVIMDRDVKKNDQVYCLTCSHVKAIFRKRWAIKPIISNQQRIVDKINGQVTE